CTCCRCAAVEVFREWSCTRPRWAANSGAVGIVALNDADESPLARAQLHAEESEHAAAHRLAYRARSELRLPPNPQRSCRIDDRIQATERLMTIRRAALADAPLFEKFTRALYDEVTATTRDPMLAASADSFLSNWQSWFQLHVGRETGLVLVGEN